MTKIGWNGLHFTFFALLATLVSSGSAWGRLNARLEDGLAITQPRILETLSERANGEGIGLGYYMDPTHQSPPNISNQKLSQLPLMQVILKTLGKELQSYKDMSKPGDTSGVGLSFHNRMFDANFLTDDRARFSLIGVVSRLDKGFMDADTCGETRLIYRLAYNVAVNGDKNKIVKSRLPITINLVLNAKLPGSQITCQEIARRWKSFNVEGMFVSNAVDAIMGAQGPLAPQLRDRNLIKQLEVNMQLSRKAAGNRKDFGGNAVYLLKVFKYNHSAETFSESPLDNQVDRTKSKAFFDWLFDPKLKEEHLSELDRGVIQIPTEFLAMRAYSIAPGGLSRAVNHVLTGTISDSDIAKELKGSSKMLNIRSVEGFKRRIADIGCIGCHQTRAIGGFHFVGQDPYRWKEDGNMEPLYPGNGIVVPGSGHFFGDLERRRIILDDLADGKVPDYSSGFASRPQEHAVGNSSEGHGALNGWGAHCYNGEDPSFKRWTCSGETKCLELHHSSQAPGMGVCVSKKGNAMGDPTETGDVTLTGANWYADLYTKRESLPRPAGSEFLFDPQSAKPDQKSGGFPGGSIQLRSCDPHLMQIHPDAGCGTLPAGEGFNDCLFDPKMTFLDCLHKYTKPQGMRACSRENPCRDDYVCTESLVPGQEDSGVCVPPYFTFQFRVDGHPIHF